MNGPQQQDREQDGNNLAEAFEAWLKGPEALKEHLLRKNAELQAKRSGNEPPTSPFDLHTERNPMTSHSPLNIVKIWQEASNRQDIDRLLELSAETIELIGPRGNGRGHQLLRDWIGRASLTLTTLRSFERGNVVVLQQDGVWRDPETGKSVGQTTLASRFRVEGGQIVQFSRYDSLDEALQEAGLEMSDEVPQS